MRGFFHYMVQLHAPIFVNVEQSASFVAEYPACAARKNIIVPYPSTDPDLFSGRLFQAGYPHHARDKVGQERVPRLATPSSYATIYLRS